MNNNSQLLEALIGSLSEEQKAALAQVLAGGAEGVKKKNPPAIPKAGKVYFFRQLIVTETVEIKAKQGEERGIGLEKTVNVLPPRVIAVDEKNAWRLYWKRRGQFVFLGSSDGETWRSARGEGKTVSEAQALEYQEMLKSPDMTPPMNREKTVFAGTKVFQVSRGVEAPWDELKKQRN